MKAMKPDQKKIDRMNYLLFVSMVVPIAGLGVAFVGLMARQYPSSRHWGVWCSIIGWCTVPAGFVLRWWVKRWFRRLRE